MADDIIKNISFPDNTKEFIPHETLILFDEVQDYPDIASSLKSFKEDGRFDCICSGSTPGINHRKTHSNSVGNKTGSDMQAMDFEEFLWEKGYGDEVSAMILEHMHSSTPMGESMMNSLRSVSQDFMIVGGMPEVVEAYISKGTFENTLSRLKELLADYREEIRKYLEGFDATKVLNVFNGIPSQLAKENKKFQI